MPNPLDITGQKYGKLIAIRPTEKRAKSGSVCWLFQCECGKQKIIPSNSVRSGLVKSCGCLAARHRETGTRLHNIWCDMRQRCRDTSNKNYGAKGIKVCKEWDNSYEAFRDWAKENGYNDSLTIDRIDGSKGYNPENCRWVTYQDQARNISRNHYITVGGETKLLVDWCEMLHTNVSNLNRGAKRRKISLEDFIQQKLNERM